MSGHRVIALLGRPDAPTDAVEEYCRYLGGALIREGFELIIERVAWPEHGWTRAARGLRRRAKGWRGAWVLVQYTALAWSARGFPLRFPQLLKVLKAAGVHVGVVFHDVEPYSGTRVIDRLRRILQLRTMVTALRVCDAAVFTVPMERISWLRNQLGNTLLLCAKQLRNSLSAVVAYRFTSLVDSREPFGDASLKASRPTSAKVTALQAMSARSNPYFRAGSILL